MGYITEGIIKAFELLITFDPETYSAIEATLKVSSYSMAASLAIGIPLGFCLGFYEFPGKRSVRTIVDTLLALPTVLIGLLVYALLTQKGPLGKYGLLFTLKGVAIGQAILALPIVIALTATAVESLDRNLRITLLSLGVNRFQLLLTCLWEARFGILTAAVAAYGRVLTEVGISLMVGGNIKWHTRTITTAIALETSKGQFAMGIALGLVLLTIALLVNLSLSFLRKRC
ncbi:ABC transporter permease [Thermodesulfatator autotrophicus]|uniref:ABC transporter permease n=1 Tax=Thermodesulfatator autotrophicus TaxID=1795632 RepID=A0A177E4U9_9BACT|nr:ABC transporter permease [Thermodesulfatator autotrophicus]OAG26984.1 ABC transporter permease [Thermodesulfatator autotrophicus]